MKHLCEACEIAEGELVEALDGDDTPYRLCSHCYRRLEAYALRPLEWYNLAKRYGWSRCYLHDDFYDEDGTASQPKFNVESPELYPAPSLSDVPGDPEKLLDYTFTRWRIDEPLKQRWRQLPPSTVLQTLTRRYAETRSQHLKHTILDVASTLGGHAQAFVRYAWGDYPEWISLSTLANASISCLPHREGFDRVVNALAAGGENRKRDSACALNEFHLPDALDWIEANVPVHVTGVWGNLAANSELDWPRVIKWLHAGRPLSLVALDALAEIVPSTHNRERTYLAKLHHPPTVNAIGLTLQSYFEHDPTPRVRQRVAYIMANAAALVGADMPGNARSVRS